MRLQVCLNFFQPLTKSNRTHQLTISLLETLYSITQNIRPLPGTHSCTLARGACPESSSGSICSHTFRGEHSEHPNPGGVGAAFAPGATTRTSAKESIATSYCIGKGGGLRKKPNLALPLPGPEIHANVLMGTPRALPTAPPAGAER